MSETYTLVGNDSSWIIAFMPVPMLIVYSVARWNRGLRPYIAVWQAIVFAWFLIAALAGLPFEWVIGGATAGGAIAVAFAKPTKQRLSVLVRAAVVVGGIAIAGMYVAMTPTIMRDGFTLKQQTVVGTNHIWSYDIPRSELRIDGIGPNRPLYLIRAWTSWTSYGPRGVVGPDIMGSGVYWGPHGLIRGDDLAKRFATWAGVTPEIRPPLW